MSKGKFKKEPAPSIDAAYELKNGLPRGPNWSDVIALFMLSLGAFGIYYECVSFSVTAVFVIISLLINKEPGNGILPQTFFCLIFSIFTVGMQYMSILTGLRTYEGRPFLASRK